MSEFNWDEHPVVSVQKSDDLPGSFNWDEHPVVSGASGAKKSEERPWYSVTPEGLWQGVKNIPETIDKYTGAPVRKFLTEAVTGEKLDKAPTGKEQAVRMGATDKSYKEMYGVPSWMGGNASPADLDGAILDTVQDPFVLAGAAKKGVSAIGRMAPEIRETMTGKQMAQAAQEQAATAGAEGSAKAAASISGGDQSAELSGQLFEKKAPKSLEELRGWTPPTKAGELPGKERLAQIEKIVPDLETKPLQYHYAMMDNPKAMKDLKLQFENLPTADAKKIAAYNQSMVNESGQKVQKTVSDLAGGTEPRTIGDAGNDLISTVKDKYNAEKEALAPAFEQLQKSGGKLSAQESRNLLQGLASNSKIGKLIAQDPETGKFFLSKNSPKSGMSDAEHGVLSRVVDDLNGGMSFKDIQNTRDFLRKAIDPANPAATAELGKVRSIMLGQLEDMAARRGQSIGDTFKKYAVNERARENVEKIIGGKIESLDSMYAANPDSAVKKIFSNPNYSKIVGQYVGQDKMNEMAASYIQNGTKKAFDSANGFNPSALRTWIKSNQQFLNNNVAPEVSQRLSALADYGYYGKRYLDEVNPSGTAASLLQAVEPKSIAAKISQKGLVGTVTSEIGQRVNAATNQRQAMRTLNESLGSKNSSPVRDAVKKISDQLPSPATSDTMKAGLAARGADTTKRMLQISPGGKVADQPTKGPEKWANDGFGNLIEHSTNKDERADLEKAKEMLISDPKGKDLLIKASDLKPGSKAMQDLLNKIKKRKNVLVEDE